MPNKITRALISVSDKTGLLPFCQQLTSAGIAIISSGGTYKLLSEHGIAASEVSAYTDFPEMMGGRIKTLHPKVHGGILARRGIDEEVMAQNGILPIDLVVSNLYPFVQTISQPDCDLARAIENIDIGGPALIRAAAKNYQSVAVVVDPTDYSAIIEQLQQNHGLTESTRLAMASKAFAYTASYDTAIAGYFAEQCNGGFPATLNRQWTHKQTLRYGENPHQQAAFYQELSPVSGTISRAVQIQGKELSYNNIADADVALECVKSFGNRPSCVIVKHANPCGVASCHSISAAYDLAYATDPTSAFGGVIAFNKPLDSATAAAIVARQFVEVLIAPKIDAYAKKVLEAKAKIRVLECGDFLASRDEAGEDNGTFCPNGAALDCKRVAGGLLVQDQDRGTIDRHCLKIVSRRQPTEQQLDDLLFAWQVAKFVKSNAIVYCKNGQTVGIGAGQMSRVYSAKIAGIKAAEQNLPVQGSAMASDAFFPFRDGIDLAAADGIASIIQPGGSIRDNEVIAAADEHNIAMVFTAMRHFRH